MLKRRIDIGEYEGNISKLLERRLRQVTSEYALTPLRGCVIVEMYLDDGLEALSDALSMLLIRDLCHFELAQLADKLPLSLIEKQAVLTQSIRCAKKAERLGAVRRSLKGYLEQEEEINLTGYMRFRMPETMQTWKLCIQSAMEDLLLEKEYFELMGVLRAFVDVKPARVQEVSLLLRPDGSCTLTDDSDARIDYEVCDPDRLVSVLVDLAPEKLTVYDLGDENSQALLEMLRRVFPERVKFVRGNGLQH
ncbi:putative sporulation protein YtxC [Christensenellaceae bacterium OttesenSCG-928-M15]|nr:putative sporulation protein YtxC [Christensenellaceae bacterium OttesenSCG-928-M15]